MRPKDLAQMYEQGDLPVVELSTTQARGYFDGADLPQEFDDALDEAQGAVYSAAASEKFILLRIS